VCVNGRCRLVYVSVSSSDVFDPVSGTFAASTDIGARDQHAAVRLLDGTVLISGGIHRSLVSSTLADAEIVDATGANVMPTGSMLTARSQHSMTLLNSGSVLVVGGIDANGVRLGTAELFDPASGTFESVGSMNAVRSGYASTALNDGRVLITGGQVGEAVVATAEVFQ
jgi:hypothetical protein